MHAYRACSGLFVAIAVGICAAGGCGKGPGALSPPEPPAVAVINPKVVKQRPTREFNARLMTKDPVKVVPRVSARLIAREFKDGAYVEGGKTVLFRIDPTLFKADVDIAKADIAKAQAEIAKWIAQIETDQAEYARVKHNYGAGTGSKSDLDKADASVKVSIAHLQASKVVKLSYEAALAKAEEKLNYCTIYAPTTGRVGPCLAAPGALLEAGKSELVSVHPTNPIYALWEVDELTYLWYRDQTRAGSTGDANNHATPIMCTIKQTNELDYTTDASDHARNAAIEFVDPDIKRGTGPRTIRAAFENLPMRGPKGELLPPPLSSLDSVRVRVSAGAGRQVLAVPESVIFTQQRKQYVYVVAEGKAQLRLVEPGEPFDGLVEVNRRASARSPSGLDESDTVIADNLIRIRPGTIVKVR